MPATDNAHVLSVLKGNQVKILNSPAAVMTEFFQMRNAATGVILGRFGKTKMSKSEDLPAMRTGSGSYQLQSLTGIWAFVCVTFKQTYCVFALCIQRF